MWKWQESIESESLYWYQARVNNKCFLHNQRFDLSQNWPISIQDQNILFLSFPLSTAGHVWNVSTPCPLGLQWVFSV